MIVCVMFLFVVLVSVGVQVQEIKESYVFVVFGEFKYVFNFDYFDYVNFVVLKGGQMMFFVIGMFDNFNCYLLCGNFGVCIEVFYDMFFIILDDEFGSYYLLIVVYVCYVVDYFWVEILINFCVCFYDGMFIIVCDVVFIFYKFMIEGVLQFCLVYKGIIVKVIVFLIV